VKRQVLVLCVLLSAAPVVAQAQTVPTIPFESVPNPLKLPNDIHLGEVAGIAVNSKGNIFVFSRGNSTGPSYMAAAAQLLEFDPGGKFIREIGKNLYAWSFAHAVRIDRQDNIWVVDKGSDMILKFNPEGRVEWVFGRKGEASHYQVPPDSASSGVSRSAALIPSNVTSSRASACCRSRDSADRQPRRACRASTMFSRTESPAMMPSVLRSSGHRAIPFAMASDGSRNSTA